MIKRTSSVGSPRSLFACMTALLLAIAVLCIPLFSCADKNGGTDNTGNSGTGTVPGTTATGAITDIDPPDDIDVDTEKHSYVFVSQDGDSYTYRDGESGDTATVTVTCTSGTAGCVSVSGNTITLSGMTENSVYTFSGRFYGNLVILGNENCKPELEFSGFTLTSYDTCPLTATGAGKLTVSAKKGTENYLLDLRDEVSSDAADYTSALFCDCDLDLQGKGTLYVLSENNNGIHTKDDLSVKNLTLRVECEDNALKGNDSVTITSGTLTLIARTGDGIKTSNSDLSSKGKQRGDVTITGGDIAIYAACDGIDAAHSVSVDESSATVTLRIFTDKYSAYSEEITDMGESVIYIRTNSATYTYSLYFYNTADETGVWKNSGTPKQVGRVYYYPIEKPSGYSNIILYLYTSGQTQGQAENCAGASDGMTVSPSYDTIAVTSRGGSLQLSWTNYTTTVPGEGGFGPGGGMNDGNKDKGDHSTKGIKASDSITVSGGSITVQSYDDCLHANSETALESGVTPTGNVTVSGGVLTLASCDDAIHADGAAVISGGTVSILSSYEGIEGNTVEIAGGTVSVASSDDGLNATATSGTGITISGGSLYVLAGGDGLDSNSRTSYSGILFSGGFCVVISTGNADSSIDTENGYRYTGGTVIALGRSGGMSRESTNCSDFSSVGKSQTLSLSQGSYLTVSGIAAVKMPVSLNALVVCLGCGSASVSSAASASGTADANGVIRL